MRICLSGNSPLSLSSSLTFSGFVLDEGEPVESGIDLQSDLGRTVEEAADLRLGEFGEPTRVLLAFITDLPVAGAGEGVDILPSEGLVLEGRVVPFEIIRDPAQLVLGPVPAEFLPAHDLLLPESQAKAATRPRSLCDQRTAFLHARHRPDRHPRHLVVGAAVERAPVASLADAAPLLEEERHAGRSALVADATDPIRVASAWPRARSRRRRSPSGCRRGRSRRGLPAAARRRGTGPRPGASRRWSIRGRPCRRFSTLTPHQMCGSSAASRSVVRSRSRIRSDRLVSTW